MKRFYLLFIMIGTYFLFSLSVNAFVDDDKSDVVYYLQSTLQEVEEGSGIYIIQGTDGNWYQVNGMNDSGQVTYVPLKTGNDIADFGIDVIDELDKLFGNQKTDEEIAEANRDEVFDNMIGTLPNDDSRGLLDGNYVIVIQNASNAFTTSKNYVRIYYYFDVGNLRWNNSSVSFTYKYSSCVKNISDGTQEIVEAHVGDGSYKDKSVNYSVLTHYGDGTTITGNTIYTNVFGPCGNLNYPSLNEAVRVMLDKSYKGYGQPFDKTGDGSTIISPEEDPKNPISPNYVPVSVPNPYQVDFKILEKVYGTNVLSYLQIISNLIYTTSNSVSINNYDELIEKLKPLFDDLKNKDNDGSSDPGKEPYSPPSLDPKNKRLFDDTFGTIKNKVESLDYDKKYDEEDGEEDDEDDGSESAITFPLKLVKRFIDGIGEIESDGVLVFPALEWDGHKLCGEISLNFFSMIEETGLKPLHQIYYLLTDAYFTFLLIRLARRKITEFAQGKADIL